MIRDKSSTTVAVYVFVYVFQGELGAQGLVGPRGPPGEGLPGTKVRF